MTNDEHNPEGTDYAQQAHEMADHSKRQAALDALAAESERLGLYGAVSATGTVSAKNETAQPTQLPAEVREAIAEAIGVFFEQPDDANHCEDRICAALAPLWADAQRDKERLIETVRAIRAVNVNEFGHVADEAIERLIASEPAMKETRK